MTVPDTRMPKRSAGILMFKRERDGLRLLLVHPGGPFWATKDLNAWTIPKGEYDDGEDPFAAAKREFREELGREPAGEFFDLGDIVQPGRKTVHAWAVEGDFDVLGLTSNTFDIEWPPKSGRTQSFPEVDRAEWFTPAEARRKILAGQRPLIDRLVRHLNRSAGRS